MPTAPRPRKKRFPEAELLARLKRYESALRSYGADLDKINHGTTVDVQGQPQEYFKKSPSTGDNTISAPWDTPKDGQSPFLSVKDEFEETQEMLRGSSEDDIDEAPITSTFDNMFDGDGGGLLFATGPSDLDLAAIHPLPMQTFALWQTFIDNVNPLIKMFHAPTVQQQVLKASSDLSNTSNAMHALIFGIYAFAVKSLSEGECVETFHESKESLLQRYQSGAQHALRRAGFLRTADLTVLQALVLYLTSLLGQVDPRSLFCLTGVADRIARRNGLHRDVAVKGLSPFEMEMRKRLWWQIIFLEGRLAEMSGAGPSILSPLYSTKIPLNVNDGSLSPDMATLRVDHGPPTEMMFCLSRCEFAEFLRQQRLMNGAEAAWQEFSNPMISVEEKERAIDDFEQLMQEKYLQHCDPQIPIHLVTIALAKFSIGKMRFTANYSRLRKENVSEQDKEYLFTIALESVESHNLVRASTGTGHFHWFIDMNKPFIALLHLLTTLRQRTTGELADRGWVAITQLMGNMERATSNWTKESDVGQTKRFDKSQLWMAFVNLLVKAWEARAAALQWSGPVPQPPLILQLRDELDRRRSDTSTPPNDVMTSMSKFGQNPYDSATSMQPITSYMATQQFDTSLVPAAGAIQFDDTADINMDFWSNLLPGYGLQDNSFVDSEIFSMYR